MLSTLLFGERSYGNVAGGGTGTGANVTATQSGNNVILANGIVSITINITNGNITNFTYNGTNLLAGGNGGGYFYIDGSGGPTLTNPTYTLTVNPANNGGNQAEVELQTLGSPMDCTLYYDLLRGQQGIYDTLVLTHENTYADYPGAELRTNMYVGSMFDWICVDPYRFRQMASPNDTYIATPGAPAEVFDFTSGIYSGTTGCKYSYSQPLGQTNVYGWASTTSKYGIWQTFPSHEYLDGGPMHRELTAHLGNTLLDMFGGGHYGFGLSQDQPAGTFTSKTFGPAFIYANRYTGTATDVGTYAQALFTDAQAQAQAEQAAWPYSWFNPQPEATGSGTTISAYPRASDRGTVTGIFAINDAYNPAASPEGMWIGLAPLDGGVDFQQQYLTYQFWVQTAAGGSFTIPNVLPGTYNLWAFGPGAAGTFEQANINVTAGQILDLGTVTWAPLRLGPTVWQIGVPDRSSEEFNNGEHDVTPWSGVLPPYAGGAPYNTPAAWSAFLDYAGQFPNDVSYTVGVSNFVTDWNYCQPTVLNAGGAYIGTTSKIYFNLAKAPAAGNQARLYIAFAAGYSAACIITINGTVQTASVTGSTDGANAAAIANSANGFYVPNYSFDTMVRLGTNGAWGDAYLNFPGTDLKAGWNEIDIGMRPTGGAGNGNGFEYDYIRLELQGYAQPSPTPSPQIETTATASPALTNTLTMTFSRTITSTPTFTATATKTITITLTATPVATQSFTPTIQSPTGTETQTCSLTPQEPTRTITYTGTATATLSTTPVFSDTPTETLSPTAVVFTPSFTATPAASSTKTSPTQTVTETATNTNVAQTPSSTITAGFTLAFTATRTWTATPVSKDTLTSTPTATETITETASETFTATENIASTPSVTPEASLPETPVLYPNPYIASGGNLKIGFYSRSECSTVEFRLFTSSFRLVLDEKITGDFTGTSTAEINSKVLARFACGSYYYAIYTESAAASGKRIMTGVLIIMR
jgi:rhamnogalacturonan endolyase